MRRSIAALILGALGLASSPAQHPGGFWHAGFASGPAGCHVEGLFADGTSQGPFPVACGLDAVTHHPSGLVIGWSSTHLEAFTAAGTTGATFPLSPSITAADIGPGGDIWTADIVVFLASSITRRNPFGMISSVTPIGSGVVSHLRSDPFGAAWALHPGGLTRVDSSGASSGPFSTGAINGDHLEVGPDGSPVVMTIGGGFAIDELRSFNYNGTLRWIQQINDIRSFDLDVCGRPHVLVGTASFQEIRILDPATGVPIRVVQLPVTPLYRHVVVDTARRHWLLRPHTGSAPTTVDVYDDAGIPLAQIPAAGPIQATHYEMTAVHLVSVVDQNGDADLDGVPNDAEIREGSDPLDPASVGVDLIALGNVVPGGLVSIGTALPGDVGFNYAFGASLGSGGISLLPLDCRTLALDADSLFAFWISPANGFASGRFGVVDPSGIVGMNVTLPAALPSGLSIFFALITVDPTGGFGTVSRPLVLTL